MADWRQIQARIRKARSAPDAVVKMTELFDHTRDAMVAFELAKLHEKAGANDDAVTCYTVAFERFRRTGWRKKAEEALVRLGAPVPATPVETGPAESAAPRSEAAAAPVPKIPAAVAAEEGESQLAFAHVIFAEAEPESSARESQPERSPRPDAAPAPGLPAGKHGRRGRRGGRGRRRGGTREGIAPQAAVAPPPAPVQREERPRPEPRREPRRVPQSTSAPEHEVEPGPISIEAALASRSKAGDPALASRSAKLESQLRRLIAAPPH
ncbi:MAG: hypothetical protein HY012_08170, partial [Acidobacteria bacterium]|nr:hypothetical protein [Acidobacteriota bacterium]